MSGVDPALLQAWLVGRSLARGVPMPVADHGGFRIDTGSDVEVARWVFAGVTPGIAALARSIYAPRHSIKLCGTDAALAALLPPHWQPQPLSYFMQFAGDPLDAVLAGGYRAETTQVDAVSTVRLFDASGMLAASGHAAETNDAFVYDRIVTDPAHRRRGLGRALMGLLRAQKRHRATPDLLVATEAGRSLYETLGWVVLSPYATASLPDG